MNVSPSRPVLCSEPPVSDSRRDQSRSPMLLEPSRRTLCPLLSRRAHPPPAPPPSSGGAQGLCTDPTRPDLPPEGVGGGPWWGGVGRREARRGGLERASRQETEAPCMED